MLTVADYESMARRKLPADVWDYICGGSGDEQTLAANRAAFGRVALCPRALVDVSRPDPATTLLGSALAAPIGVAPMAYHRLADPEGEVATARAAGAARLLLVVSPFASRSLEEVAAAASGGPLWMQVYWLRQREVVLDLVGRAEAAGYRAIVLTVDTPRVGRRLRDMRHGFSLPPGVAAVNIDPAVMAEAHRPQAGTSALAQHSRQQFDPSLRWSDVDWLRRHTTLPVVLKGLLSGADAARALDHGVAAVVVSNHGGRQLDGAVASLDALPGVVAAVGGRCPVLLDGGVRTGVDVLRALALGADAVLVGRPVLWGLACGGADGVRDVLGILTDELEDALVLSGRPRLSDVDSSLVAAAPAQAGRR